MTSTDTAMHSLSQDDTEDIRALLLGHRIVKAEEGSFKVPNHNTYWGGYEATGRLTLDDGTQILVIPNQGGCACSAGDYELTSLAAVDNVITRVDLFESTEEDEDGWESPTSYRIYVYAEAKRINILQVDGDDGNGYYGTGYELIVIPGATS